MDGQEFDLSLDLRGLKCPLPVLKARRAITSLEGPALVRIETTDPLAGIDIPHFCSEDGHELVSVERDEQGHLFVLRKLA